MGKTVIIYYSLTGNTKSVSKTLAQSFDAKLIQIKEVPERTIVSAYFSGIKRIFSNKKTEIFPVRIDLTPFNYVIIGTPVWAWNPTPAIKTFLEKTDFSNKKVILFTTQRLIKARTLDKMKRLVEKNSGKVIFTFSINTILFKKSLKRKTKQISEKILKIIRGV